VFSLDGQQINGVFRERITDRSGQTMYRRPIVENVRLFGRTRASASRHS